MRQQQDTTGAGVGQGLPVTRIGVAVAVAVAGLATMQLVGDGLPPALLAEHGVDVQFAVDPTAGGPVGRILADGDIGDRTPVVDAAEIARAGGRPSALALPTSMAGSVWFTLACTPR